VSSSEDIIGVGFFNLMYSCTMILSFFHSCCRVDVCHRKNRMVFHQEVVTSVAEQWRPNCTAWTTITVI